MIEPITGHRMPGQAAMLSNAPDDDTLDVLTDRRRPGRAEVSPALVPLLRGEHDPGLLVAADHDADLLESDWDYEGALKPARGIIYGLLLSLPLWAALLATCHVAIKMITLS